MGMIGKYAYGVEVQLLNFAAQQGENLFNDVNANTLLDPANKPDHIVVIVGIETYFNSIYLTAPSGRAIVSQAQAAQLAVTLRVKKDDYQYQTPYLSYSTIINYGRIKEIEPMPINMSKSGVYTMSPLASNVFSAYFNFWYDVLTKEQWQRLENAIMEAKLKYGYYETGMIKMHSH